MAEQLRTQVSLQETPVAGVRRFLLYERDRYILRIRFQCGLQLIERQRVQLFQPDYRHVIKFARLALRQQFKVDLAAAEQNPLRSPADFRVRKHPPERSGLKFSQAGNHLCVPEQALG